MTARLFTLDPLEGFHPKTFAGHRDAVVSGFFGADSKHVSYLENIAAVHADAQELDLHCEQRRGRLCLERKGVRG